MQYNINIFATTKMRSELAFLLKNVDRLGDKLNVQTDINDSIYYVPLCESIVLLDEALLKSDDRYLIREFVKWVDDYLLDYFGPYTRQIHEDTLTTVYFKNINEALGIIKEEARTL